MRFTRSALSSAKRLPDVIIESYEKEVKVNVERR